MDDDEPSEINTEEGEEISEDQYIEEQLTVFDLLEREYHAVLNKMKENDDMKAFGEEYTNLFETFEQTYKHEQELIKKIEILDYQVSNLESKIEIANKQNELDCITIDSIREEVERSWKLADKAHAREQLAQEIIENMRTQIVKLNNELELKSKLGTDEGEDSGAGKTKEGFEREKQRMMDEIIGLKQKLVNALSYSEELEHKNSAADLKATELSNCIEQNTAELSKQQRLVDKLNTDIKSANDDLTKLTTEYDELNDSLAASNKLTLSLETNLKEQKTLYEKSKKECELLGIKIEKYKLEAEMTAQELNEKKDKLQKKIKQTKQLEEETIKLRSDAAKIGKQRDNMEKKLENTEKCRFNLENERNKLRNQGDMMEREIAINKKHADNDKREIDNLSREKDILLKNIIRVQNISEQHLKLIKIQEQSKRKLESDLNGMRQENSNQKKELNKMEKDRNRALEETMDLTQQVEDAMDEIKMKQQSIYEYKKTILEIESKLRQQQNLFEIVRADRNAFQKSLQESTAECGELKTKLKISAHQAEQLKEDIAAKEALLLKEENILRKLNKEKENLKVEVQSGLDNIHKLKCEINELHQTEISLTKTVQENETTIRTQAKDLEQIMNDRDIIGAQLVRRNDELGLLYEKINILQITLRRGESQYDQRIEDIRLLKLEIKRLRQERTLLSKSISNMTDLKHEVFQLERELAQERLKTSALEEELQHPLNIHRWRKLEGSDPQVLEMLQKIQILQKRLLSQTAEAVEREKQLKETERLYLNLRQVLSKQPGPDIKAELNKTQKALVTRGCKMKCLVSELNMYESQIFEYKMDLEKVTEELKEVKAKYLRQKKQMQKHLVPMAKKVQIDTSSIVPKFSGGGFKMAPVSLDKECSCP